MMDHILELPAELDLGGSFVHEPFFDVSALFEQYEPANDADIPSAADEACENLYATPW